MSPPRKKRKTKKPSTTQGSALISLLPNDLLLSCFARVSRLHYGSLSLVSKRFRSLIASPELYETRSLLSLTESCLYVCLGYYPYHDITWFTLYYDTKNENKKKKESSGNHLVPIPFPVATRAFRSTSVAIGTSIYFIGGYINGLPCSNVSILDCWSHTWHQAPDMQVARSSPVANVIDGKIYVVGGCNMRDHNSSNWIEVFDPKTQIWNSVSSTGWKFCGSENIHSIEIDGKICMFGYVGGKGVAYNPKDGTCEPLEWGMCEGFVEYSHCVVGNVLFYYHEKKFKWYDTKARLWRNLKGLERLVRKIAKKSSVELADYGGNIVVLWDRDVFSSGDANKVIWCAVIAVERRENEDEIWGTVEWFDVVLTVPTTYKLVRVLATTL